MRKAAGLPPDTVPAQHHVEPGSSVRESQPHKLTRTVAGVPGRIPPGSEGLYGGKSPSGVGGLKMSRDRPGLPLVRTRGCRSCTMCTCMFQFG